MVDKDLLYARILEYMQGGVLALDAKGYVEAFNPAAERMLGLAPERADTHPFATALFDNPANDSFAQALLDAVYEADTRHTRDVEYFRGAERSWLNLTTSALWSHAEPGVPARKIGVVALFIDITERKLAEAALHRANTELEARVEERTRQLAEANRSLTSEIAERVKAQDELAHLAEHDALTGLPNRRRFEQSLIEAIAQGEDFALLYLDLDGFKTVNDTHGHEAGDDVLRNVSRRLEGCVRDGDVLARLGGDEFAVILRSSCTQADVEAVVDRIIARVGLPHDPYAGRPYARAPEDADAPLRLGVSVGVALFPHAGLTPRELIHASDAAMYAVKTRARRSDEPPDK